MSSDFDARRAIEWGSIWAVAVAVCEALAMSPERWTSAQLLIWWLIYWLVPLWAVVGALLLWLLNRSELRSGWRGMLLAFLLPLPLPLFALPLAARFLARISQSMFPAVQRFAAAGLNPLHTGLIDVGIYNVWVYFFYGGLLMSVFVLTVRTERFRLMLHASAMERSRTQGLLDGERLQTLQGQIDPNLLLDSMRELEQRYRSDPERAEKLLEALVEFLRNATHGLRVPVSTLDAEMRLARAFAQLQRERGAPGHWRVAAEDLAAGGPYRFPSLLILRLLALGGATGRPLLRVRSEAACVVVQLMGLTEQVSEDLRQHVLARLRTLYGTACSLHFSPAAPTQLSITLDQSPSI